MEIEEIEVRQKKPPPKTFLTSAGYTNLVVRAHNVTSEIASDFSPYLLLSLMGEAEQKKVSCWGRVFHLS